MRFRYSKKIELFFDDEMDRMGYLFEYCDSLAESEYGFRLSKENFVRVFMNSGVRASMDNLDCVRLLIEPLEYIFKNFIEVDLKGDYSSIELAEGEENDYYAHLELFWIGQAYTYIHHKSGISSECLYEMFTLETMRDYYITGHQLSFSGFYNKMKWMLEEDKEKGEEEKSEKEGE